MKMNKEITPLEALDKIIYSYGYDKNIEIVSKALKDYEMEHTLRIRLENTNYELVREKQENDKKIKALEIIDRKNVDINVLKNVIKLDDNVEVYNDFMKKRYGVFIEDYEKHYLLTKDEFDILKLNIKYYED